MPCDSIDIEGITKAQRERQIKAALARLEAALQNGSVSFIIGPNGAIAFKGWSPRDRDRVTDACAYRRLTAAGSSALRVAKARAETMQGRKVNEAAVSAGVHSHDGGKTWGKD